MEGRVTREVSTNNQGIDKKTYQFFQLRVISASNRRTDEDIVAVRVSPKQRLECREQDHEKRCAMPLRELRQRSGELLSNLKYFDRSLVTLNSRTGSIGWQV